MKRTLYVRIIIAICVGIASMATASAQDAEAEYAARFLKQFPKVESPPTLTEYATPQRFDERFMGDPLEKALGSVSNQQGNNAWGLAYWMNGYNEMYRATGDPKYLAANLRCIDSMLAARDDKQGLVLWTGATAPAWSSEKYAERGRAVFAVHTGMIVYPMLDALVLLRDAPDLLSPESDHYKAIQRQALEALAYHDRQWVDGPGEGEGHYVGIDQEDILEGKVLPGNRLSAMGRALWAAWKLTGDEAHRNRAIALGQYIKRRLGISADGAYYWEYWLPDEPVTDPVEREEVNGEDTSHGQLTASFPIMLAAEGVVFDEADLRRFGLTVLNGIARRNDGILYGNVTGSPGSNPNHVSHPYGWLHAVPAVPEVKDRLLDFYLQYQPSPGPLDFAYLLTYAVESP